MHAMEFEKLISSDKPVLVDFYADWCEPCKWLDPVMDEVEQNTVGNAATLKVDVERNPEMKDKYNIRSVPVLIIFRNGRQLWRMNGFLNAGELTSKLLEFV